jgi:hypothetical protein
MPSSSKTPTLESRTQHPIRDYSKASSFLSNSGLTVLRAPSSNPAGTASNPSTMNQLCHGDAGNSPPRAVDPSERFKITRGQRRRSLIPPPPPPPLPGMGWSNDGLTMEVRGPFAADDSHCNSDATGFQATTRLGPAGGVIAGFRMCLYAASVTPRHDHRSNESPFRCGSVEGHRIQQATESPPHISAAFPDAGISGDTALTLAIMHKVGIRSRVGTD